MVGVGVGLELIIGGFVTSKGWIELGNPVSVKISLKLFNINNCNKGFQCQGQLV
jgi:predicted acyltransferase (DUF342 family)